MTQDVSQKDLAASLVVLAEVVGGLAGALATALREAGADFSVEIECGGRKVEFDHASGKDDICRETIALVKQAGAEGTMS